MGVLFDSSFDLVASTNLHLAIASAEPHGAAPVVVSHSLATRVGRGDRDEREVRRGREVAAAAASLWARACEAAKSGPAPKGKKGKAQDFDQKWAEMDQWVSQIPHGKHSLHVGESLTVKLNYPMQGGVMPASVDMELIFTLSKIEGSIATFDLTPKLKFEADHPLLKGLEATGDGVLVFDAKQRLTKNMRVSLKLESHAEVRPGMIAHALITSDADGLSSRANSRCSTVMNSCRCCRASTKAMCRLTSSSWAIM